jgi:hypothetical protein
VAERSDDTAFGRAKMYRFQDDLHACESGVALRFPPQSMTGSVLPIALASSDEFRRVLKITSANEESWKMSDWITR